MAEGTLWSLRQIGVVRSQVRERKQMPPLGAPAAVEVFPEYLAGLLHLEKHSHIWVLAWLDGAERDLLQVVPRGVRPEESGALHGVFAVRSPARPNPIGLTVTRVLSIEGPRIEVARLDFVDGTPVVDLKPYFANRDLVFAAANTQIGRPAGRENLRDSLLEQAVNFHGELCGDLALAVRVFEHFRWEVLGMKDPPAWNLAAPWKRGCLLDALLGMTRATPGRGNLRLTRGARVRFHHDAGEHEYLVLPDPPPDPAAILAAHDRELFTLRARPASFD